MTPLLLARMRRNAERARAVGISQCFFAALLVAAYRRPASAVVAEVEVAAEYFGASAELLGERVCLS